MSERIELPRRYPWWARLAFRAAERSVGQAPDPWRITARRPRLLLATIAFEWAIRKTPRLRTRLKMLAALRVSSLVGCPF
jgi:alkylhydroperoxidase family enzyme